MKRLLFTLLTTGAAVFTLLSLVAAPASAANQSGFNVDCSGTITAHFDTFQATYGGPCTGSRLGQGQMTGAIQLTAQLPAGSVCAYGGFTATHTDTLTANDGNQTVVGISETSCQTAPGSNTYRCSGTYTVQSGTATTGSGKWGGVVTFTSFNGPTATGTYHSTYSN